MSFVREVEMGLEEMMVSLFSKALGCLVGEVVVPVLEAMRVLGCECFSRPGDFGG